MLYPVRRPITTLDCVLLKDNNRALVARSGPEINSWACICVLQGPRHNTRCWFSIQCFIFLLIFWLETPKKGSCPRNLWTEASLASLLAISFPYTPACSGTQYRPHSVPGRDIVQRLLALSYRECRKNRLECQLTNPTEYSLLICLQSNLHVSIGITVTCWACIPLFYNYLTMITWGQNKLEFNTCYEFYFIKCTCWQVYWFFNFSSCLSHRTSFTPM